MCVCVCVCGRENKSVLTIPMKCNNPQIRKKTFSLVEHGKLQITKDKPPVRFELASTLTNREYPLVNISCFTRVISVA